MKKTLIAAALFAATVYTPNTHANGNDIQHLVITSDISGSSSILTDNNFAEAAISLVKQQIVSLDKGAWVEIKTFGDGSFAHIKDRKIRISSRGTTPDYVAGLVENELHEIRAKAGDGQSSTNLLAFLELEELHCDTGASTVVIISDTIESSVDVSAEKLLNGQQSLPEPDVGLLAGCRVTIIGLGNVSGGWLPRDQRRHLEKAWRDWFAKAGVDELTIIHRP